MCISSLPLRGVRTRSALGARVGGTLSAVRGKFASTEGVLCSFVPDTVAGHNVNLLFCSLAPSGGGSRPAAGTPLAPSVEALVLWHCAVAARTPPQACLQRRQWRLLSAMFSREHMTIQTGVLNVFKCFVFLRCGLQFKDQHHFQMYFFVRADQRPVLYAFAMAGNCESMPFCLSYFNCGRQ